MNNVAFWGWLGMGVGGNVVLVLKQEINVSMLYPNVWIRSFWISVWSFSQMFLVSKSLKVEILIKSSFFLKMRCDCFQRCISTLRKEPAASFHPLYFVVALFHHCVSSNKTVSIKKSTLSLKKQNVSVSGREFLQS